MVYYSALHWAKKAEKSVEECQNIKNSLGDIYKFKGSVQTNKDLPTNANVGDVYDVIESGNNYAWTGTEWDSLGLNVDLSNYALKSDLNSKQDALVSGTNIKTVNGESVLGSGNIDLSNYALKTDLTSKQDKLTAGTGIKIENNVISNTQTSAEWGNIEGDISSQTDLQNALNGKANLNLGNSTAITNCITEIPQDIKLEIANNQVVAKAGSKLYIPNGKNADGSNKFDEFIINSDISVNILAGNFTQMIFARTDNTMAARTAPTTCFSGSTAPSGYANMAWYDTANNLMKITSNSGSTWTTGYSLPLGIYTTKADYIANIDQVFNGFGYIGSTIFALPNVKGLIPDGRNADGSLRNIEFVTQNVVTRTLSGVGQNKGPLCFDGSNFAFLNFNTYGYNYYENYNYNTSTGNKLPQTYIANFSIGSNSKLEFVLFRTPFKALDYFDTHWIAEQSFPSGVYTDLTLGASGSKYTAPANGCVQLVKRGNQNQYAQIVCGISILNTSPYNGGYVNIWLPIKKGDSFIVLYDLSGSTDYFRFYYAEGEN